MTDKPDYPRCRTCKFLIISNYDENPYSCEVICHFWDDRRGPNARMHIDKPISFLVTTDFGCALHEPKEQAQ